MKLVEVDHQIKGRKVPRILKITDQEIIKLLREIQQIDNLGKTSKSPNGQLEKDLLKHPIGHTMDNARNHHFNAGDVVKHIILRISLIVEEMKLQLTCMRHLQ